jgi:hypothetical protein
MKLDDNWGHGVCEVCGNAFNYLLTTATKKRPPRACKGHCTLILEEREGRVAKTNWNTIRERRNHD